MSSPDGEVMVIEQVAVYLKLSRASIAKLIKANSIPFKKIGGAVRFYKPAIDSWLTEGGRSKNIPELGDDETKVNLEE